MNDDERGELIIALAQATDLLHVVLTNAEGLVADLASGKQRQPFFVDLTRTQHEKCRAELVRIQALLGRVLHERPLKLR
jgi:hypothetical protein